MKILALDAATHCGWALGEAGAIPRSGTIALRKRNEDVEVSLRALNGHLRKTLTCEHVHVLAIERFIDPRTIREFVDVQGIMFYSVALVAAHDFGVTFFAPAPATVRKFFLGRANMGDRQATKRAVIKQCHILRLMPTTCLDDNRADAIAVFMWAEHQMHSLFSKGKDYANANVEVRT